MKENIIRDKSFQFALKIMTLSKELQMQRAIVLSRQVLRAGTSIGANIEEAIGAFSKSDFTYKMNISLKEAHETHFWLRLLDKSDYEISDLRVVMKDCLELVTILSAIVKTSKQKNQ
ncbi:four helix bundle protein [Balneola sp. MJW-20]|uniref:four helix bundle protein n=1 Tax=Gracilimonas aurantiaca TaxID=3234185 RepID=UPI0034650FD6